MIGLAGKVVKAKELHGGESGLQKEAAPGAMASTSTSLRLGRRVGLNLRLRRDLCRSTRLFLPHRDHVNRNGLVADLALATVGAVFAQDPDLEKDFAERVQRLRRAHAYPGTGVVQHGGDFVARKIEEPDEGDHLGVLLAQALQAEFDVAHEDRLIFE